ncbi:MAG TPA: SAM-dependent methyltransferase [Gemmatimonadales bacterium]|nr:SAM-dependent methyltransferase [Gemmatimonadales bacterium]
MERALYEPGLGYYATSEDRATRTGDFLTAPELHPVFAATVSRQVAEMRERLGSPADFTLREYGAGTGAFGGAIAARLGVTYEPREVVGRQLAQPAGGSFVGVVLANELLDALPFHRLVRRAGELKEVAIDWAEGRLVEREIDLTDDRLRFADNPVALPEGQRTEMSLASGDWLREIALDLTRGYALLFDYALPQADLYSPVRSEGTARAFRGHHVSSDLLGGVGRQDITAHINLDALARQAREAGFQVLGTAKQNEFLLASGLDQEYAAARDATDQGWETALALRSAIQRLLDPNQLGGYRVVVLVKGVDISQPLAGLTPIKRPGG